MPIRTHNNNLMLIFYMCTATLWIVGLLLGHILKATVFYTVDGYYFIFYI